MTEVSEFYQAARDTLENLVTGLGTGSDKSTYSRFIRRALSEDQLTVLYRFGGIGGKAVDVVPDDAVRKWRDVTIPAPLERSKFDALETELGVAEKMSLVGKWARLFGGSAIVIETNPNEDTQEPLNEASFSPSNPVVGLEVRTRYDFTESALDPKTLRPTMYEDLETGQKYHPSRILGPFDGIVLPRRELKRNKGWGGSIIERCFDALLLDAETAAQIPPLVHEALVKHIGVKDLARFLKNATERSKLTQRFALAKFLASVHNIFLYDPNEEELSNTTSVTAVKGLSDTLNTFANRIAGIVDIPMTRLYGQVSGGLNTTGATNLKDYYNMVASYQRFVFAPALAKLDRILLRSAYGQVPADYWYEWAPLDEPTDAEQAATDDKKADTDTKLINAGVIVSAQAARRIQKDGPYDLPDDYVEALEEHAGLRPGKEAPPELAAGPEGLSGAGEVQAQVLNGTQIASLVEIAKAVRTGELGTEQGQEIMMLAVPGIEPARAARIAGPEGVQPPQNPPNNLGPATNAEGAPPDGGQTQAV